MKVYFSEENTKKIIDQDVEIIVTPDVFWKDLQQLKGFKLAINEPGISYPHAYLYGIPVRIETKQI